MSQEVQTPVEAPSKRLGRPKGSKNTKVTTKKYKVIEAPSATWVVPPPLSVPDTTTVPLSDLTKLADYIDYWKKEAHLSTLQCLKLYAR